MSKPKSGERVLKVWVGRDAPDQLRRYRNVIGHAKRDGFKSRVRAFITIPAPKAKRRK